MQLRIGMTSKAGTGFLFSSIGTGEIEWNKLPGIQTNEIVLLTSYVDQYLKCEISCVLENSDEKIQQAVNAGVDGLVFKPIMLDELENTIQTYQASYK